MKLFQKAADGGKDSGVTGYFLIEIKPLFSIVLLHFRKGSRDAYHSHAFNAVTLWLKGYVIEREVMHGDINDISFRQFTWGQFKYTPRECMHKIVAIDSSWALSVRGPWVNQWREWRNGKLVYLTHGRKEIKP
jgi:hypothetical protein